MSVYPPLFAILTVTIGFGLNRAFGVDFVEFMLGAACASLAVICMLQLK